MLTDAKPSVDPGAYLPISCCVSLFFSDWLHLKICLFQMSGHCLPVCVHRRNIKEVCYCGLSCVCRLILCVQSLTCCWLLTPRLFFPPPLLISLLLLYSHLFFFICLYPLLFLLSFRLLLCLLPPWQLSVQLPVCTVSPSRQRRVCTALRNKPLFCTTVLQQRCW